MEYAVNHILSIVAIVIRSGLNVLLTTVSLLSNANLHTSPTSQANVKL